MIERRISTPRVAHGLALTAVLAVGALALLVALPLRAQPSAAAVSRAARALLGELVARDLFSGAVVIGRDGRELFAEGFGLAERERRLPFTPDTPMDGASIAKPFTAAAVLGLAHEGRLDLDAPVGRYVAAFPHAATTVRHLLSHAAGLPGYEWLDTRVPPDSVRTNASHLAAIARGGVAPAFAPGSAIVYDNVAYDVLAMVVEGATRRSYADVLRDRLLSPLALSAFVRPARFADFTGVRTRGYRWAADGWELHDAYDLEGFHGAANLYLSARDLQRWMAGYRRVVGDDVVRLAGTPARLTGGRSTGISLGSWYLSADSTRRYYTGHHNGFHLFGYADDARGLTVAWIANSSVPAWLQAALSRALVAIAEGREPERMVAPNVVEALERSGTYDVPTLGEVVVVADSAGLRIRVHDVEYAAFPVEPGVHFVPGLDAAVWFHRTPAGDVVLRWDSVFLVADAPRSTSSR